MRQRGEFRQERPSQWKPHYRQRRRLCRRLQWNLVRAMYGNALSARHSGMDQRRPQRRWDDEPCLAANAVNLEPNRIVTQENGFCEGRALFLWNDQASATTVRL